MSIVLGVVKSQDHPLDKHTNGNESNIVDDKNWEEETVITTEVDRSAGTV